MLCYTCGKFALKDSRRNFSICKYIYEPDFRMKAIEGEGKSWIPSICNSCRKMLDRQTAHPEAQRSMVNSAIWTLLMTQL